MLHLCALGEGERILDVDAEIADGAFDLRVAERSRVIMHVLLTH